MFAIGKHYGAILCETEENILHSNATCFIVLGTSGDVSVTDEHGVIHTGSALRVKPLVKHTVASTNPAWHVYLAPYSTFAVQLSEFDSDKDISALPAEILPFHSAMLADEFVKVLDHTLESSAHNIDPRLVAILEEIESEGSFLSLTEIAKKYDLSASRLRAIANQQIDVPLSTLILFRKSVRAVKKLSTGATLSEAAQAGGFCDQAHFTRTIRQMFGTTPSATRETFDYENE